MRGYHKSRIFANSGSDLSTIFDKLKSIKLSPRNGEQVDMRVTFNRDKTQIRVVCNFRDGESVSAGNFYITKSGSRRNNAQDYEINDYYGKKTYIVNGLDGVVNFFKNYWDGGFDIPVQASARIGKRHIKAGYQSFGNSGNPWADIEALKDSYIKQWWRDYDGDPVTSWDNIFDNALAEFQSYADVEASGFLLDKYTSGEIGDGDMRYEFDNFVRFSDLNDFDF